MTETLENRSWEYYGFPNPEFMDPRLPWLGLLRALAERYKQAFGRITYEDIFENDNPGNLFSGYDVPVIMGEYKTKTDINPGWGYSYETVLRRVCTRYLNPSKLADVSGISSISDLMWTYEDIRNAAAEKLETEVITQQQRLNPIWPLAWIRQQYTMINLLRFLPVEYKYHKWYLPTHYREFPSIADSFNFARANKFDEGEFHTGLPFYYGIKSLLQNGEVKYTGDGRCFYQCNVDLPDGLSGAGKSYLVGYFREYFGGNGVFGLTFDKIKYGWNALPAQEDGVFLDFNIDDVDPSEIPDPGRPVPPEVARSIAYGWETQNAQEFTDYNEIFYFKQEDNFA